MDKIYKTQDSNTYYCKAHFQKKYKREPNITDIATVGVCRICVKNVGEQ